MAARSLYSDFTAPAELQVYNDPNSSASSRGIARPPLSISDRCFLCTGEWLCQYCKGGFYGLPLPRTAPSSNETIDSALRLNTSLGCPVCALLYQSCKDYEYDLSLYWSFLKLRTVGTASELGYDYSELVQRIKSPRHAVIVSATDHAQKPKVLKFQSPGSLNYAGLRHSLQRVAPALLEYGPRDTTFVLFNYWFGAKSSDEALHNAALLVHDWLRECINCHLTSRRPKQFFNPSRLLHVSNNKLQLVCSSISDKPLIYATLSHCWGSLPMFKLKKDNLSAFQEAIPEDQLCKTFREAI